MPTPKLGILASDEKALQPARESDPVSLVVLRSTLINPPRAAGARAVAQHIHKLHPRASVLPYVWHLVSHGPEDHLRELATRSLPGEARRFGHLQDSPEVRDAWQTSLRCAQEFTATQVVLRTPASFTPSGTNQARLAAFVEARAAEGIELVWEAEGLWEPAQTLSLARKLGMQVILPVFYCAVRPYPPSLVGGLARTWLRVDGAGPTSRLRGVLAEALAHALSIADAPDPVVLFAGPRAYANLRAFATEMALYEDELAEDEESGDEDVEDDDSEDAKA